MPAIEQPSRLLGISKVTVDLSDPLLPDLRSGRPADRFLDRAGLIRLSLPVVPLPLGTAHSFLANRLPALGHGLVYPPNFVTSQVTKLAGFHRPRQPWARRRNGRHESNSAVSVRYLVGFRRPCPSFGCRRAAIVARCVTRGKRFSPVSAGVLAPPSIPSINRALRTEGPIQADCGRARK
jgi:hypothetical protein